MGFTFEYVGMRYGEGPFTGLGDLTLFGRLTGGSIALDDEIVLPTTSGVPFVGVVIRFQETFHDWLGLPFYNVLTADSAGEPFCIAVYGQPPERNVVVPAVASSEAAT